MISTVSILFRQQTEQATQKLAKETHSYLKQLPHLYGDLPSDRVCIIHYNYYFNLVILYWIYYFNSMQIHCSIGSKAKVSQIVHVCDDVISHN